MSARGVKLQRISRAAWKNVVVVQFDVEPPHNGTAARQLVIIRAVFISSCVPDFRRAPF